MTDRADYWAKHPGVIGTLSNNCIRLHDSYWTQGPDGKAYPTWHPPVATASGEACYFGHEHGDDPGASPFYVDAKYKQQRDERIIPIPFGYANEVLAANGGARHEDHFGHKIYRENFQIAYGNSATNAAPVTGSGTLCTALLKLHQGTHSADALTHHLHEAVAHVDCTSLQGHPPSRVHVTTLVPIGRPGWFSNNCGSHYRVPGQTNGTQGSGENNAPAGGHSHLGNPPVALGGPSRIADIDTVDAALLESSVDGERIIPGAGCLRTYEPAGSAKANKLEFGHAPNDTWVRPLMITDETGRNPRMFIKSYYSVFNPSRVFWIDGNGSVATRPSVEACRTPPPGGPTNVTTLCQRAIAQPGIGVWNVDSPYNGTVRNVNFKSLHVGNHTGNTTIWTDTYGRTVRNVTDPARVIRQYVSNGYNGMAGLGVDASIAVPAGASWPPSLKVCRSGTGLYPSLSVVDACYWDGDLLFAKEWWRDYRDPALRIHAPN